MVIRVALCMVLFAAAVPAQWKRYSETFGGGGTDAPPAHDLQYFKVHPCSRSDKKDRIADCPSHPSEEELQWRASTRTEPRIAGKIGDFTVYDLEYFLDGGAPGPQMRSVLVETSSRQFHEVLFQESTTLGTLFPTEILKAGQQLVIKVKYDDGGNYHFINERYFVMLDGVAVLLDFGPVIRAAEEALPSGFSTYQPATEFDFKTLMYSIATVGPGGIGSKIDCCVGRVTVPFRIEKGLVVAGKAVFDPDWNPFDARRR